MNRMEFAVLAGLWLAPAPFAAAQGVIGTYAGTTFILPSDRFAALAAPLGRVRDVAIDSTGSVFLSDEENHVVMKWTPDGSLQVVAGNGIAEFSGERGPAIHAAMHSPLGLALDSAGNLYIADPVDHRVRRVTRDGLISTYAGTGRPGYAGDGGLATESPLNEPRGIAIDGSGNLYIADSANHRVRRVRPDGVITTVAGTGEARTAGDGGSAANAAINTPGAVAVDAAGNLFVAETDRIRRVDSNGVITTVLTGFVVSGLTVSPAGVLYFSDSGVLGHQVLRVSGTSAVRVAGNQKPGFSGDGGAATEALLNAPGGLAIDPSGNLWIADRDNFRLRRVDASGIINTIAGNGQFRFSGDGEKAVSAALNQPVAVAPDGLGGFLVADLGNHRIRGITAGSVIDTLAGSTGPGFSGDGGPATSARLNLPQSVAAGPDGSIYIADQFNDRVRRVAPDGTITTFAGGGSSLGDNGPASQAQLNFPWSVAVDRAGNVLIADSLNNRIRRVGTDGIITTIAGTGTVGFSGDGGLANAARLSRPRAVHADSAGRIFISDTGNNRVRVIGTDGRISTVAGGDSLDGPRGLTTDAQGNVYVAEFFVHRVRRISPGGTITTVAGTGTAGFSGDGGPATQAQLNYPQDVAIDQAGNLYIADTENDRVRVVLSAPPAVAASAAELDFAGEPGGLRPPPLRLNLSASISGLPFAVDVQTRGGGSWLTVSPVRGVLPASLEVTADPGELGSGIWEATIRVTVPNASPGILPVAVKFTVEPPAGGAILVAEPRELPFTFVRNSAPRSQTLIVSTSLGQARFSAVAEASSGGNWLSVTPASGVASPRNSVPLRVTVDPGRLASGTYLGRVTVSFETGNQVVPITLTISEVEQTIALSQAGLAFTSVADGGIVPPQSVAVLNIGQGIMNWTATARSFSQIGDWIRLSDTSGATDAASLQIPSISVFAKPVISEPGEYYGQVQVTAPTAVNTLQFVTAVLEVLPAGSDPGPTVQPAELIFAAVAGGVSPGSQNLLVYNIRGGTLAYKSRASQADWLSHLPTDAAVAGDQPTRIVVQPLIDGLSPGVYRGVLALDFYGEVTRRVSVLLVLLAPALSGSKSLRAAQGDCVAKELLPSLTSLPADFGVSAALPTPLVINVVDDCGRPMTQGSVIASFSNGDPPIALQSLNDGSWAGTWTRASANTGTVVVTVRAEDPDRRLEGQARLSGSLRSSQTPLILPGGVRNASSLAQDAPLSPGALITIWGQQFASGASSPNGPQLPLDIDGTRVLLAGLPIPLVSVSESQISAILPYELAVNTRHQVLIRRQDKASVPVAVTVAIVQPGIFTEDGSGHGRGLIYNGDNQLIGAEKPAAAGDEILVLCSGLGPVDPPVVAGAVVPESPPRTAGAVSLSIGGRDAKVTFAGLAPKPLGVYQVRAIVPPGVSPGAEVEVWVSVDERRSNPVTLAVH